MKNMENNNKDLNTTRQDGGTDQEQEPKTFTQEEVDEIVRKRLMRERKKMESGNEPDSGSDRENSLAERELKVMAREKLLDAGMPSSLADVLRYSDEKSLEKAMEEVKNLNKEPPKAWGQRMSNRGKAESDPFRKAMGLDR